MANYASLKAAIQQVIKQNGNNEITGAILQSSLLSMINSLGAGYQFMGVAVPSTNPGTPDQNVFYLASTAGTYTNFNGAVLASGEISIFKYNGSWTKDVVIASILQGSGILNVNYTNGVPNTAYSDAETARAAVPSAYRKYGLVISYLLADGWHIEQYTFLGSINPWQTSNTFWKPYDYKPEYTVYNLNAGNSTTTYTLAQAIAAVPSEYRSIARAIIFGQTGVGVTLAIFNSNAYVSGWENTDNWLVVSPQTIGGDVKLTELMQTKRFNNPTRKIKAPINLPLIYGQIYSDGTIQKRGDGMRYEEIIVSPTAKYYYTGTARVSGIANVVFYDENGTRLGTAIVGTGSNVSYSEQELTLPDGTYKMRVGSFIVSGYNQLLITVEDYATRFVEDYGTNDLWAKKYTDVQLTMNARDNIQVDGTIIQYSSGAASNLITIDHSKKYKLETTVDQYCCGVAYYSDLSGTQCVGFQITSYASKEIAEILNIPSNAVTMRVGTRIQAHINLYEIEYMEAATLAFAQDLQSQILQIGTAFVDRQQGAANYGKVLVVGPDGFVTLGTGGGDDPTANAVVEHQAKTLYLGPNIIDNPTVVMGTGWSGSLASGFAHSSGNTAEIVIQQATTAGKKYLVECQLSVAAEASIYLSIGDGPKADVYNGGTTIKIGFISDGGYLKITPASSFNGSVSNVRMKEVVDQDTATETLNINVNNIENGTMVDNITGFWNVVLGTINTMQHNENGSRNIVLGYSAMGAFKSGTRNVMVGTFAGCNLQEGDRNIAIGADAFWYAQKAKDNIAIGYAAMGRMNYSQPNYNIAIGSQALGYLQADAVSTIAIGRLACNYSGKRNVGVGEYACYWTRGNDNVAIGNYAQGYPYETGDQNVAIGAFSRCGNAGTSLNPETINNAIAIGYNAVATKSNQVVIGNANHTEFVFGTKKLVFNNDNTIGWETI